MWQPDTGDFILTKASYCFECNNSYPCNNCLKMDNVYVISNTHNGSKTVGGKHCFYFGHLCNRDGGCLLDETSSEVILEFPNNTFPRKYEATSIDKFAWIPRLDQIVSMINDNKVLSEMIMSWTKIDENNFDFQETVLSMYVNMNTNLQWNDRTFVWE